MKISQLLAILLCLSAIAADADIITEKSIYIPKEIGKEGMRSPESKWSVSRMVSTPDVALFWAPGFGSNIETPPALEGNDMSVDLANLMEKLQKFYNFFRDDLKFVKSGSRTERHKMMVMLDYSLEGTAYGGDYDGVIGALWIAPNRVKDRNLNCIAHELGHSFQSQVTCDGEGEAWGGCGFFEMTSQWMLWQINPLWQEDERFHLDAFSDLTHKAFLHIDNIYHSPYIIEFWGEKHGLPFIAEMFRQGKTGEDPAMTYMRMNNMTQREFCDEMFQFYRRLAVWDIDRVKEYTASYSGIWHTGMDDAGKGWKRIKRDNCPENYGFNIIPVEIPSPGKSVKVDFRGEKDLEGYITSNSENAGWRYGFVALDKDRKPIFGKMNSDPRGSLVFRTPDDRQLTHLWLVVMGAPEKHVMNIDGEDNPGDPQYPYSVRIR